MIFGATWTLPQARFYGVTFTGDRLLGLVAVGALVVLALSRRLRWTGVHVALGVSLATQLVISILNMKERPQGLKFSALYLSFARARRSAGRPERGSSVGTRWSTPSVSSSRPGDS